MAKILKYILTMKLGAIIVLTLPLLGYFNLGGSLLAKKTRKDNDVISVSYNSLGVVKNNSIIVNDTIDLKGGKCELPKGFLLNLRKGAIRNGEIVGNETKLKCNRGAFVDVRIRGTWRVPVIRSSFFQDVNSVNSLKNVIALTHTAIKNKVYIEKGLYNVSAPSEGASCLLICDNTTIVLDGTIQMEPNSFQGCKVIEIRGNNVILKGHGTVVGDKDTHQGMLGEWGMGISILHSNNVLVSGLTMMNCWGDCVYVGEKSENVTIERCILDHSRRQGISITSAANVIIKDNKISNVAGTLPEFGIDIEPDPGESCVNVCVENVSITNCKGGILSWGGAPGAFVEGITIKSCKFSGIERIPFRFDKCNSVLVENCELKNIHQKELFTILNVTDFVEKRNKRMN